MISYIFLLHNFLKEIFKSRSKYNRNYKKPVSSVLEMNIIVTIMVGIKHLQCAKHCSKHFMDIVS